MILNLLFAKWHQLFYIVTFKLRFFLNKKQLKNTNAMEFASFSSLSQATNSEKSLLLKNFISNSKIQTSVTEKESRMSNRFIHTPEFNKNFQDRPLIDQGLDIIRHNARLENRQVKDKSYYMGLLHRKGYEIGREIKKLVKQIQLMETDQSTHFSYKQRAENQASELRLLQATLFDYNVVDDMYNTDTGIDEIREELRIIKSENELESAEVEKLFELNKKQEDLIHELETDISQEKYVADILSATSSPSLKNRYKYLKKLDEGLKSNLLKLEKELKILMGKRKGIEDNCKSHDKSEAFSLMQKLNEVQIKRDNLTKEQFINDKSGLLNRKREYNDLIKCLGNQKRNVKHQIQQAELEFSNMDMKDETIQTERVQKMAKLKTHEKTIDNFLAAYPEKQAILENKLTELHNKTKTLLRKISSQLNFDGLEGNWNDLKSDYSKEDKQQMVEKHRAKYILKQEILELLAKDELEDRLVEEIMKLKEELFAKKIEIDNFSNIEQLKKQFEVKENELLLQVENIRLRRDVFNALIKDLQMEYEALESQLQKSDVNKQLTNLEREWHYLEQNNFEMKEFLAEAKVLGDYSIVKENVMDMIKQLNGTFLENKTKNIF